MRFVEYPHGVFITNTGQAKERPKKKQQMLCVVCLNAGAEGVFVSCGHKCCCMSCGNVLTACPICRCEKTDFIHFQDVSSSVKIFT